MNKYTKEELEVIKMWEFFLNDTSVPEKLLYEKAMELENIMNEMRKNPWSLSIEPLNEVFHKMQCDFPKQKEVNNE